VTRLNYTGRKRVTRDRVRLRLTEPDGKLLLDVQGLQFKGLRQPDDAEVIVEAYRQTARRRVPCGTVGALCLPTAVPLAEFDVPDGLLFRVKVVGVGDADGKLLAAGDRIPAVTDNQNGDGTSILPFKPSSDLGQQLWRLDTDPDPLLLINSGVGDWKGLARQPYFQALVFPELVRQAAMWVLANMEDPDENEGAASNWRRLLAGLGKDPVADPPQEDEQEQWADDVAEAFARKHKFLDRMIDLINAEAAAP
jgi:hypothetical protein